MIDKRLITKFTTFTNDRAAGFMHTIFALFVACELDTLLSINSTTLTLSWDRPPFDQINGLLRHYVIDCTEHETASEFRILSNDTQVTLQSLHPYYTYTCRVAAVTTGSGPYTGNLTVKLPEDGELNVLIFSSFQLRV